jgi:2-aminobenzoate-CoA ligase
MVGAERRTLLHGLSLHFEALAMPPCSVTTWSGRAHFAGLSMLDASVYPDDFVRRHLPPPELWPVIDRQALAALGYPKRFNVAAELLDGAVARGLGDRACIRAGKIVWSYAELLDKANRIAAMLVRDLGVVPGNRVLLRSANNPMLAACWFAVLKAGCVAVTTMPLLRARELSQIMNKAKVQFALCDARLAAELEAAKPACPTLREVRTFNSDAADSVDVRMKSFDGSFDNVIASHDDAALIGFTSGTTGPAKATVHFHRDLLAICDSYPEVVLKSVPDDIIVGSPPLGFTYGLGSVLLFPMRRGCSTVLLEQVTPDVLLQAVQDHRATTLMTGPTMYRAMAPLTDRYDLSSLHTCCSAGEHLPVPVFDDWQTRTGIRILDHMGSTEMLHAFMGVPRDDIRPGTTGIALPGYTMAVVDEAGDPVPSGTIGRLAVKGPIGCRYLDDPQRQQAYVKKGWNITGDAFHVDDDGFYWYHSRTDDMIVSSGYNISGSEIEEVLLEHPAVKECAVVGVADSARGQVAKAFIVPRDMAKADGALLQELQDFVKQSIAPYKYPRAIEFVADLPRTETGKVQRAVLRARG